MVYHVVSWNFLPHLTPEQRQAVREEVLPRLAGLKGQIPGLVDVQAFCPPLEGSNCDLVLLAQLEQPSDLPVYQNHPKHLAVAQVIKANFGDRRCCDVQV